MGLRCSVSFVNNLGYPTEIVKAASTGEIVSEPLDFSTAQESFISTFLQTSRSLVPVDTGYLQSTLTCNTSNSDTCVSQTNCEYAEYVEYGTWCQSAQEYFTPAIDAAISASIPDLEVELSRAEDVVDTMIEQIEEEAEEEELRQATQNSGGGGIVQGLGAALVLAAIIFIAFVITAPFRDAFGSSSRSRGEDDLTEWGTENSPEIEII